MQTPLQTNSNSKTLNINLLVEAEYLELFNCLNALSKVNSTVDLKDNPLITTIKKSAENILAENLSTYYDNCLILITQISSNNFSRQTEIIEAVKYLLAQNASPVVKPTKICILVEGKKDTNSALHHAARENNLILIILFLLHHKKTPYDLDTLNDYSVTALALALSAQHFKIAELLVKAGAYHLFDHEEKSFRFLLHLKTNNFDEQANKFWETLLVKYIQKGYGLNTKLSDQNENFIQFFCRHMDATPEAFEILRKLGGEFPEKDNHNLINCLALACMSNNSNLVKYLIERLCQQGKLEEYLTKPIQLIDFDKNNQPFASYQNLLGCVIFGVKELASAISNDVNLQNAEQEKRKLIQKLKFNCYEIIPLLFDINIEISPQNKSFLRNLFSEAPFILPETNAETSQNEIICISLANICVILNDIQNSSAVTLDFDILIQTIFHLNKIKIKDNDCKVLLKKFNHFLLIYLTENYNFIESLTNENPNEYNKFLLESVQSFIHFLLEKKTEYNVPYQNGLFNHFHQKLLNSQYFLFPGKSATIIKEIFENLELHLAYKSHAWHYARHHSCNKLTDLTTIFLKHSTNNEPDYLFAEHSFDKDTKQVLWQELASIHSDKLTEKDILLLKENKTAPKWALEFIINKVCHNKIAFKDYDCNRENNLKIFEKCMNETQVFNETTFNIDMKPLFEINVVNAKKIISYDIQIDKNKLTLIPCLTYKLSLIAKYANDEKYLAAMLARTYTMIESLIPYVKIDANDFAIINTHLSRITNQENLQTKENILSLLKDNITKAEKPGKKSKAVKANSKKKNVSKNAKNQISEKQKHATLEKQKLAEEKNKQAKEEKRKREEENIKKSQEEKQKRQALLKQQQENFRKEKEERRKRHEESIKQAQEEKQKRQALLIKQQEDAKKQQEEIRKHDEENIKKAQEKQKRQQLLKNNEEKAKQEEKQECEEQNLSTLKEYEKYNIITNNSKIIHFSLNAETYIPSFDNNTVVPIQNNKITRNNYNCYFKTTNKNKNIAPLTKHSFSSTILDFPAIKSQNKETFIYEINVNGKVNKLSLYDQAVTELSETDFIKLFGDTPYLTIFKILTERGFELTLHGTSVYDVIKMMCNAKIISDEILANLVDVKNKDDKDIDFFVKENQNNLDSELLEKIKITFNLDDLPETFIDNKSGLIKSLTFTIGNVAIDMFSLNQELKVEHLYDLAHKSFILFFERLENGNIRLNLRSLEKNALKYLQLGYINREKPFEFFTNLKNVLRVIKAVRDFKEVSINSKVLLAIYDFIEKRKGKKFILKSRKKENKMLLDFFFEIMKHQNFPYVFEFLVKTELLDLFFPKLTSMIFKYNLQNKYCFESFYDIEHADYLDTKKMLAVILFPMFEKFYSNFWGLDIFQIDSYKTLFNELSYIYNGNCNFNKIAPGFRFFEKPTHYQYFFTLIMKLINDSHKNKPLVFFSLHDIKILARVETFPFCNQTEFEKLKKQFFLALHKELTLISKLTSNNFDVSEYEILEKSEFVANFSGNLIDKLLTNHSSISKNTNGNNQPKNQLYKY